MRIFLSVAIFSCAFLLCAAGQELNFTGTDGAVYKNASVLKVMPDGLVISYIDSNGFEDIRKINISQLPDDLKKQYKLSAQAAAAFDSQRTSVINAIEAKKEAENKAYYAEQKKEVDEFTKVTDYLEANEVEIIFNSINQVDFGSIGYAYRADDYDKEAPFGLICLLGKSIEPDQDWVGKVYPLNKSMMYQTPFSTQPVAALVPEIVETTTGQLNNANPQEGTKKKIPCYGDYSIALDYFSNHPQAIGK